MIRNGHLQLGMAMLTTPEANPSGQATWSFRIFCLTPWSSCYALEGQQRRISNMGDDALMIIQFTGPVVAACTVHRVIGSLVVELDSPRID